MGFSLSFAVTYENFVIWMEKLLQRILKETKKGSVALTRDKSLPLLLRELLHINLQEVSERQYPGQKSDSYFSGSSIQLVLGQITKQIHQEL